MENTKLYHKSIMWDSYFDYICRKMINERNIVISDHAFNSFKERDIDKGYIFALLKYNRKGEIFEVEKNDRYINKFVIRMPYDLQKDVCIVLRDAYDSETQTPYLIMPTVWLNNRNDKHFTLDASKYEKSL